MLNQLKLVIHLDECLTQSSHELTVSCHCIMTAPSIFIVVIFIIVIQKSAAENDHFLLRSRSSVRRKEKERGI